MIARYRIGPIHTPPVVSRAEGPLGTLSMAINGGGTVWTGGPFDPETRIISCFATTGGVLGLIKPNPAKNDMNFVQGSALTSARAALDGRRTGLGGRGRRPGSAPPLQRRAASAAAAAGRRGCAAVPPQPQGAEAAKAAAADSRSWLAAGEPPYGSISAISLDRGEILWQIATAIHPTTCNNPALKGLTIPRTGQAGIVGTLVTKTLLISGEPQVTSAAGHPRGALLRAYDKATGKDAGGGLDAVSADAARR